MKRIKKINTSRCDRLPAAYHVMIGSRRAVFCVDRGLEGLWKELDEFLISDRWCIWTPDYMYMDIQTGMPGVVCVPVEHCVSMPLPREKFIQSLEAATGWRSRPVNALPHP